MPSRVRPHPVGSTLGTPGSLELLQHVSTIFNTDIIKSGVSNPEDFDVKREDLTSLFGPSLWGALT
jgi:hypothetical protein